jgi:hypothetical protein
MKLFFVMLLFLVGCGGHENDRIEKDSVKTDRLLIPPCLEQ